jgi:asparaginyl-tRNA synthetase
MNNIENIVRPLILSPRYQISYPFQICKTVEILLANPTTAALIKQLNPKFEPPTQPFMRLSYVDAIKWLNDHGIQRPAEDAEGHTIKDDQGQVKMVDHQVGDDIAEAAERQMTDIIGKPVFLHGFPAELKAFYMKKVRDGDAKQTFTESCDLLMPNVGEIVGKYFCRLEMSFFLSL